MRNRSRRWAERAVLGLMLFIGIAVLVGDPLGWLERLIPQATIPKITLLVLCTVTLFLLLEVERFHALDDIHATIGKLDIDGLAKAQKVKRYAGVSQVVEKLAESSFDRRARTADHIDILNTWMPNLADLVPSLKAALDSKASIRILLLYPGSDVAQLRDEALRKTMSKEKKQRPYVQESVAGGVRRNFALLEAVAAEKSVESNGKLEVRVYNTLPSICIHRAGQCCFVGFFLHGKLAVSSPQVELDGMDTPLGKHVQDEFDAIWRMGKDINPLKWQRDLNNVSFHPEDEETDDDDD